MSMTMDFLGINLAKNVFALHEVDDAGRAALVRPPFVANIATWGRRQCNSSVWRQRAEI